MRCRRDSGQGGRGEGHAGGYFEEGGGGKVVAVAAEAMATIRGARCSKTAVEIGRGGKT